MKGIFFSEFVEMVEQVFSPELADMIIESSALGSDGVYTAGGNYDFREMLKLVDRLSEKTGLASDQLMEDFGDYMFGRLSVLYPEFFVEAASAFDFLSKIEGHIHTEIRKIYPDSELATFATRWLGRDTLVLTYTSPRPFAAMALGLMKGCCRHFGENITIARENLSTASLTRFRFTLKHCQPASSSRSG